MCRTFNQLQVCQAGGSSNTMPCHHAGDTSITQWFLQKPQAGAARSLHHPSLSHPRLCNPLTPLKFYLFTCCRKQVMPQHYQATRGCVGLAACVNLAKIKMNPVHQLLMCCSCCCQEPAQSSALPVTQAALELLQQQEKGKGGWFAAELASADGYSPDSCLRWSEHPRLPPNAVAPRRCGIPSEGTSPGTSSSCE